MLTMILLAISGSSLWMALVWILAAALIFFILNWAVGYIGLGEPFAKIAKVVIVIIVLILLFNAIFLLAGQPFIRW